MNMIKFFWHYITAPRDTGAVLPSSEFLARKMVTSINFKTARCIVEYGAGTGVFTKKIIDQKKDETILIVFEKNLNFYQLLLKDYGEHKNVYITNDSAAEVGKHLKKHNQTSADFILSGLPFASLPKEVSESVLQETKKYLHKDGEFILFQYTLLKLDFLKKYFSQIKKEHEWRNVPPAYVLRLK